MTDRFRCSCGYSFGPDLSGPDSSVVCPGCGSPLSNSMNPERNELTHEFRPVDDYAATQTNVGRIDEHVLKLKPKLPLPPPDIPGYEILGELGRGGMGVVYQAKERALNRIVALKMILSGAHAAEGERLRFRKEAEAVAALQHPGIVQIFHIGEHSGQPYLALEFVDGGSLAQRITAGDLMPAKDAAAAVEQVARASQYAHDQGIIHRDLKPANILISSDRGTRSPGGSSGSMTTPRPAPSAIYKISDFGLAKKVDETIAAGGGTKSGAVMGTPSYIAPEQASGRSGTVSVRSDVYSLGAILYELLTGRPPFKADTPLETVLQVLNDEPVPPSRLRPKLPRDLETICLKCLDKDQFRRYATAAELADDLQRFQKGEPILARPLSPLVRGWKWVGRHPAISAFALTAALALVTVVTVLAVSAVRLADLNTQKEQEADTARKQKDEADRLRGISDAQAEKLRQANLEMKAQEERNRRNLFALQLAQVAGICEKDPARAAELLDDERMCPTDLRDFAWRYLRRQCLRDERTYAGHMRPLPSLAISPDGQLVATGDTTGMVRLWSPVTRAPYAVLVGHAGAVNGVAFGPDGRTLATTGSDGTVRIWSLPPSLIELVRMSSRILPKAQDELSQMLPPNLSLASTLRPVHTIRAFGVAGRCVAFSADGRWLAAGGADPSATVGQQNGMAKVWDTEAIQSNDLFGAVVGAVTVGAEHAADDWDGKQPTRTIGGHFRPVTCLAFSPDGRTLAVGSEDRGVQLASLTGDGRAEQLRQHGGPVYGMAFSPDGQTLATTDNLPEAPGVVLWDLSKRRPTERVKLLGHTFTVKDVAFAPDGRSLATVGATERDATVRIWDAESGTERVRLSGHKGGVNRVAWMPDRKHVVTVSDDATARVWQTAARACDSEVLDAENPIKVAAAVVSENGRTLVTADVSGEIRIWAIDRLFGGRKEKAELPVTLEWGKFDGGRPVQLSGLAVSENGSWVAAATSHGVAVWDLSSVMLIARQPTSIPPKWLARDPMRDQAVAVRFGKTAETLYAATVSGLRMWDVPTGKETTTEKMRKEAGQLATRVLAVSPVNGAVVANTIQELTGHLTVLTSGGVAHSEQHSLWSAEFSPDGKQLVTITRTEGLRVWEIGGTDAAPTLRLMTETREPALAAQFSRDGQTVFAVGVNRDVMLVDPITGQERAVLSGHTDRIVGIGLLTKDSGLITIGREGTVKRWRADPLMRFELRPVPGIPRVPAVPNPPTRRNPGNGRGER